MQLIFLLFCLPFYVIYWCCYALVFLISIISGIYKILTRKKDNKKVDPNILDYDRDYNISNIKDYYNKLHYNTKENKEKIKSKKEYNIVQLTDTELRLTTEKIQELYKELGFNVKVVGIEKKKYITEYEVIFPKEITQFDILSVSSEIVNKFQIDGVKIVGDTKKDNRMYIQIPLRYQETLT